jgi:hypothetical protein
MATATIAFSADGQQWLSPWYAEPGSSDRPRYVRCHVENAPTGIGLEWISNMRLADGQGQSDDPDEPRIQWIETSAGEATVVRVLEDREVETSHVMVRLHTAQPA